MSEFENTISYATFYNTGGAVSMSAGSFVTLDFAPTQADGVVKNINSSSTTFTVIPQQTGAYYVDFSFIAKGGDGKNYTLAPFINDSQIDGGTQMALQFHQQSVNQEYEVSGTYIFNLSANDNLNFKIKVGSVSSTSFLANNIKLTMFNLQQLGIH